MQVVSQDVQGRWSRRYIAGVSLAAGPKDLPAGLEYTKFEGGKYSRFVLTGPYSDLPEACGRVFEIVSERKIRFEVTTALQIMPMIREQRRSSRCSPNSSFR